MSNDKNADTRIFDVFADGVIATVNPAISPVVVAVATAVPNAEVNAVCLILTRLAW